MKLRAISITLRLTLLFASVSTAVLLLLGWLIGNAVEQHFVEQDLEQMNGKLHLVGHLLEKVQNRDDLEALPGLLDDSLVGHHALAMQVMQAGGSTLFSTGEAQFPPSLLRPGKVAGKGSPLVQTWQQTIAGGVQPMRGMAALLPSGMKGAPPFLVAVGVDISHHQQFLQSFRKSLWLMIALALLLLGLLGWLTVRHGLAPLQAIRQGAAGVTANRLNYRLPLDAVPVELAELARTLNQMLARLEESFQRLKDFSSDLAHELRTPINNLMTQTQVVLSRARSDEEYRDVLASNLEEYEQLARMIADMLFLAQADNGLIVLQQQPIELAAEVRALFDFFDALAEEKSLSLLLTGTANVVGDKLMLRRALANLLSNAIRHSPVGGEIRVEIRHDMRPEMRPASGADSACTVLAIHNRGEPIPPHHLPHIFERFYRADPSRHRNGEGAGLGLALARSIVLAHGGQITVQSSADGVCFEIWLDA